MPISSIAAIAKPSGSPRFKPAPAWCTLRWSAFRWAWRRTSTRSWRNTRGRASAPHRAGRLAGRSPRSLLHPPVSGPNPLVALDFSARRTRNGVGQPRGAVLPNRPVRRGGRSDRRIAHGVLHRPRSHVGRHAGRLLGLGSEHRARLRLDFRPFRAAGAWNRSRAWATVCSLWCRVAVYTFLMLLPRYRRRYRTWSGRRFNATLFTAVGLRRPKRIATARGSRRLHALPIGRRHLGQGRHGRHHPGFQLQHAGLRSHARFGIAPSTLVGQQLGNNNPNLASRATRTSLCMALGYMGTMALVYVLFPNVLLIGHAANTPPAVFASCATPP